jgi:glycosyltransferase involved in cell wall biosynthesis
MAIYGTSNMGGIGSFGPRLPLAQRGGPLRIAILGSRGYPSTYGGYETLVRQMAKAWSDEGHEITVYCRDRPEQQKRSQWEVDGVRCISTLGYESKAASTLSFGLTSHADAAFRDFDVALILNVANGYFLKLLEARGIPTVVNTDGIEWVRGKWGKTAKKIFYEGAKRCAKDATLLISDSIAISAIWSKEFGVSPRFVPYGAEIVDEPATHKLNEVGIEPGSYALAVARLVPENNVDLLLDALERTGDHTPAVIVGSANYDAPIAVRLQRLHDAGKLNWLGHVHDQELLTQLWSNAAVYVHGHSVGGTNPALLQALGAGAPTLALDTPFNLEVLLTKDQLYPKDPDTLAEMIGTVISDPTKQAQFRDYGQDTIRSRYQWQDIYDGYERVLRDAVALKTQRCRI